MTREELLYLKPGDKCMISKGLNKRMTVIVDSILNEFVTVRPTDDKRFNVAPNSTTFYDLQTFSYKSLNLMDSRKTQGL